MGTPIAHVGIALVLEENVYIFESGPRGAQLRNLEDYLKDGADCLWWKKINVSDQKRKKITLIVEYFSNSKYSWEFLKDIPKEILKIERNYSNSDIMYNNCAEIVAKIYNLANILDLKKTRWLPIDFLKPIKNHSFDNSINVIFNITK